MQGGSGNQTQTRWGEVISCRTLPHASMISAAHEERQVSQVQAQSRTAGHAQPRAHEPAP